MNIRVSAATVCVGASILTVCMSALAADPPAAPPALPAAPAPTTQAVARSRGLEQLQRDMDDFIAAAKRGDRDTVLCYIGGPASPRKREACADVYIGYLQADEVFRSHFNQAPTGVLAAAAETLSSRLKDTAFMKSDGSAATSMHHYAMGPQGLWQLDVAEIHPQNDADLGKVEQMNQAVAGWIASVRAGTYATPAAALQSFESLLRRPPSTRRS